MSEKKKTYTSEFETDEFETPKEDKSEVAELKKELAALRKLITKKEFIADIETTKEEAEKKENEAKQKEEFLNERVPYHAFYDGAKYKDDIHVGVNGYVWVIKRGETVMIPRYVKDVLDYSEKQTIASMKHSQNLIDKFNAETRALGIK